ncbi:bifunctional hydroxymethylpyrimidine kinase/phosphomethylpyrimidine kinase [Halomonas piscis]|uniref:hydroxymethylpyrimidine kinase n=1 Tax=Halomonas piscis TaxID=3031727 RepID=A0ABY9YZX1_9GAMM|nr:bifunctional hydroxymethylpyrimidine kinase/phosphomethylpyrimidine kinase [Halomonas piscis]WNK20429.1 bifunctional hydroxymethylpyrimidine kinase/phosphomethylpyrimidine kinase [Halomonas piscis]
MSTESSIPRVLTVAGSDPSGGAGIQADLKAFSALGGYGASVITALTAQNTQGVRGVEPVSAAFIAEQLDAVLDDIEIDAVKIGMVASLEVAEVIARALEKRRPRWIVLDPVMVAKSGDVLVDDVGIRAVRDVLVPLADVITPNLPEAAVLLDAPTPATMAEMEALVPGLTRLGAPYALLKGGHLEGAECPDLLATPERHEWLTAPRIATHNLHGTGCSLSSAIAASLAQLGATSVDADAVNAIAEAKRWLHTALEASDRLDVGQGCGPVHHFHAWW